MSAITLTIGPVFPEGTTVGAYTASGLSDGGNVSKPFGEPIAEATVQGDGTLSFNLGPGDYIAAALVNGTWRRVSFSIRPPATPSGGGVLAPSQIETLLGWNGSQFVGGVLPAPPNFLELPVQADPGAPAAGKARIFPVFNPEEGIVQLLARFSSGSAKVLASQDKPGPVTQRFFPNNTFEEDGVWTNRNNVKAADGALATVSTGATQVHLQTTAFLTQEVIPPTAEITAVKVIVKQSCPAVGEPKTGVRVKSGAKEIISYADEEATPAVQTERAIDLTGLAEWTPALLSDGVGGNEFQIYLRARNAAATTVFSFDFDCLEVTWVPKLPSLEVQVHTDDGTIENPEPTLWGHIEAVSPTRHQRIIDADGEYRRMTVKDGDLYEGETERAELGRNEHRFGEAGGAGTMAVYDEGDHRQTFFDLRLRENFQLSVSLALFQVIMQMKQAQPSNNGSGIPKISMEANANRFNLHLNYPELTGEGEVGGIAWSTPAEKMVWYRFRVDAYYSLDPAKGYFQLSVQKNPDRTNPTTFVPDHSSPKFAKATLKEEVAGALSELTTQVKVGTGIPAHLRLGIYHNTAINSSSGEHSIDLDNIRIIEFT